MEQSLVLRTYVVATDLHKNKSAFLAPNPYLCPVNLSDTAFCK